MSGFLSSDSSSSCCTISVPCSIRGINLVQIDSSMASPPRCSQRPCNEQSRQVASRLTAGSRGRHIAGTLQTKTQKMQRKYVGNESFSSSQRKSRNSSNGQEKCKEISYDEMLERFNRLRERMCRCPDPGDRCRCTKSRTILEEEKQTFVSCADKEKRASTSTEPSQGTERITTTKVRSPHSGYIKETIIEMSASCNAGTLTITKRILEKSEKDDDLEYADKEGSEETKRSRKHRRLHVKDSGVSTTSESSEESDKNMLKDKGKKSRKRRCVTTTSSDSAEDISDDEQPTKRKSRSRAQQTSSKRSSKRNSSSSLSHSSKEELSKTEKRKLEHKKNTKETENKAEEKTQKISESSEGEILKPKDKLKDKSSTEKITTPESSKEEISKTKKQRKTESSKEEVMTKSSKEEISKTKTQRKAESSQEEVVTDSKGQKSARSSRDEISKSQKQRKSQTSREIIPETEELQKRHSTREVSQQEKRHGSKSSGEIMPESEERQKAQRSSEEMSKSEKQHTVESSREEIPRSEDHDKAKSSRAASSNEIMSELEDKRSSRSVRAEPSVSDRKEMDASPEKQDKSKTSSDRLSDLEQQHKSHPSREEIYEPEKQRRLQSSKDEMDLSKEQRNAQSSDLEDVRSIRSSRAVTPESENRLIEQSAENLDKSRTSKEKISDFKEQNMGQSSREGTSLSSGEVLYKSEKHEQIPRQVPSDREEGIVQREEQRMLQKRSSIQEQREARPSKEVVFSSDEQTPIRSSRDAVFNPKAHSTLRRSRSSEVTKDLHQETMPSLMHISSIASSRAPHPPLQCCPCVCQYCAMKIAESLTQNRQRQQTQSVLTSTRSETQRGVDYYLASQGQTATGEQLSNITPPRYYNTQIRNSSSGSSQQSSLVRNTPLSSTPHRRKKRVNNEQIENISQPTLHSSTTTNLQNINDISAPTLCSSSSSSANRRQPAVAPSSSHKVKRPSPSQSKNIEHAQGTSRRQGRNSPLIAEFTIPNEFNCELLDEICQKRCQAQQRLTKPRCCCCYENTCRMMDTSSEEHQRPRAQNDKRAEKHSASPPRIKATPVKNGAKARQRSISSEESKRAPRRKPASGSPRLDDETPPSCMNSSSGTSTKKTPKNKDVKSSADDKNKSSSKNSQSSPLIKSIMVPLIYFGPQPDSSGACKCAESKKNSQARQIQIGGCSASLQANMVPISIQYCEATVDEEDGEKNKSKKRKRSRRSLSGEDTSLTYEKRTRHDSHKKRSICAYLLSNMSSSNECPTICPCQFRDCQRPQLKTISGPRAINNTSDVTDMQSVEESSSCLSREDDSPSTPLSYEANSNLTMTNNGESSENGSFCICSSTCICCLQGRQEEQMRSHSEYDRNSFSRESHETVGEDESVCDRNAYTAKHTTRRRKSSSSSREYSNTSLESRSSDYVADGPPSCNCVHECPCQFQGKTASKTPQKLAEVVVKNLDTSQPVFLESATEKIYNGKQSSQYIHSSRQADRTHSSRYEYTKSNREGYRGSYASPTRSTVSSVEGHESMWEVNNEDAPNSCCCCCSATQTSADASHDDCDQKLADLIEHCEQEEAQCECTCSELEIRFPMQSKPHSSKYNSTKSNLKGNRGNSASPTRSSVASVKGHQKTRDKVKKAFAKCCCCATQTSPNAFDDDCGQKFANLIEHCEQDVGQYESEIQSPIQSKPHSSKYNSIKSSSKKKRGSSPSPRRTNVSSAADDDCGQKLANLIELCEPDEGQCECKCSELEIQFPKANRGNSASPTRSSIASVKGHQKTRDKVKKAFAKCCCCATQTSPNAFDDDCGQKFANLIEHCEQNVGQYESEIHSPIKSKPHSSKYNSTKSSSKKKRGSSASPTRTNVRSAADDDCGQKSANLIEHCEQYGGQCECKCTESESQSLTQSKPHSSKYNSKERRSSASPMRANVRSVEDTSNCCCCCCCATQTSAHASDDDCDEKLANLIEHCKQDAGQCECKCTETENQYAAEFGHQSGSESKRQSRRKSETQGENTSQTQASQTLQPIVVPITISPQTTIYEYYYPESCFRRSMDACGCAYECCDTKTGYTWKVQEPCVSQCYDRRHLPACCNPCQCCNEPNFCPWDMQPCPLRYNCTEPAVAFQSPGQCCCPHPNLERCCNSICLPPINLEVQTPCNCADMRRCVAGNYRKGSQS